VPVREDTNTMRHCGTSLKAIVLFLCGLALAADSSLIRPGVWGAQQPETLPLPTQGYEVYLVGEIHGVRENADFQLRYLEQLHRSSGVRDLAIEERRVFEEDAQAYVDGRLDVLPPQLCLRASILEGIRRLNTDLREDARIRIHLTDIDSPAVAIRRHLVALQQRLGANGLRVPDESGIKEHGLETVTQLKHLNPDSATRSELRTVEFSIISLQQGLEFDLGPPKGVPYLDSREEAVAANIVDLIRVRGAHSLLVVYGSDHVSRTPRKGFAGPKRDQLFTPMALRLERSGLKTFSMLTLPLEGQTFWRGQTSDIFWTANDAHLASGETIDKVIATESEIRYIYIDPNRERAHMPGEDLNRMAVDAFLLFRSGTPISDRCGTR
jgi:hypothetical protein